MSSDSDKEIDKQMLRAVLKDRNLTEQFFQKMDAGYKEHSIRISAAENLLKSDLLKGLSEEYRTAIKPFLPIMGGFIGIAKSTNSDARLFLVLAEAIAVNHIEASKQFITLLQNLKNSQEGIESSVSEQLQKLQKEAAISDEDKKNLAWMRNYLNHTDGESDDGQ